MIAFDDPRKKRCDLRWHLPFQLLHVTEVIACQNRVDNEYKSKDDSDSDEVHGVWREGANVEFCGSALFADPQKLFVR